jgi:hypothetical protein
MSPFNNWKLVLLLCLTLGLAPFFPEPHIFGKVRWILGGAQGMALMDWFDTLLHGFPYVLLIRIFILKIINKNAS